jgi:hypothetical protein
METTHLSTPKQRPSLSTEELEAMVGPDRHRPGRARWRLITEEMPIWAIIGHIVAIGETSEPDDLTPAVIAQVAEERGISFAAVTAALHYYQHNRCPIDTLLEANAAALG